ncbi:hypothetical protein LTR66_016854, partial [Elasticomyces elasticus]
TPLKLPNDGADTEKLQKIYDQRRAHKDRLLRDKDMTVALPAGEGHDSDFTQTRRLMPQRDRLAESFFHEGSLRDSRGCQVMHDLIDLCRQPRLATDCSSLNKAQGECDVCGKFSGDADKNHWEAHVYHCRKEAAAADKRFAEFCFLCFVWIDKRDRWEEHCEEHLRQLPVSCGVRTFRRVTIRPGLYPECLGDQTLSAMQRFHQYRNINWLKKHILKHIDGHRDWRCRHPRCQSIASFQTRHAYIEHLAERHQIRLPVEKESRSQCSENTGSSRPSITLRWQARGPVSHHACSIARPAKRQRTGPPGSMRIDPRPSPGTLAQETDLDTAVADYLHGRENALQISGCGETMVVDSRSIRAGSGREEGYEESEDELSLPEIERPDAVPRYFKRTNTGSASSRAPPKTSQPGVVQQSVPRGRKPGTLNMKTRRKLQRSQMMSQFHRARKSGVKIGVESSA